ncbi:MAG: hypothetical protein QF464_11945, partial [Myxococcota bacterium]|nr:hypothetical protein [Myxococcota bacterium]
VPSGLTTGTVEIIFTLIETPKLIECEEGVVDIKSCGWNLSGESERACDDGQWSAWSPCSAPEVEDCDGDGVPDEDGCTTPTPEAEAPDTKLEEGWDEEKRLDEEIGGRFDYVKTTDDLLDGLPSWPQGVTNRPCEPGNIFMIAKYTTVERVACEGDGLEWHDFYVVDVSCILNGVVWHEIYYSEKVSECIHSSEGTEGTGPEGTATKGPGTEGQGTARTGECDAGVIDWADCEFDDGTAGEITRFCDEDGFWTNWGPCNTTEDCDADDVGTCTPAPAPLETEVIHDATDALPKKGCTQPVYHAFSDCRGGFWHVVTTASYTCDGEHIVEEVHVIQTNQPCEAGQDAPAFTQFVSDQQPVGCGGAKFLRTIYGTPTCELGTWWRPAYALYECIDGRLYTERDVSADINTGVSCDEDAPGMAVNDFGGAGTSQECEQGSSEWIDCEFDDGSPGTMSVSCDEDGYWTAHGDCQEALTTGLPVNTGECDPGVFDWEECDRDDGAPGVAVISCVDGAWTGGECEAIQEEISDTDKGVAMASEFALWCSGLYQNDKPGGTNYKVGDRIRIGFMHRNTVPLIIKTGLLGESPGPNGLKSHWDLVQDPVTATCPIVAF